MCVCECACVRVFVLGVPRELSAEEEDDRSRLSRGSNTVGNTERIQLLLGHCKCDTA